MHILAKILILFVAAQLLGAYTGVFIIQDAPANPIVQDMIAQEPAPSFPAFLFYILIGVAVFLMLIRLRIGILFTLLEVMVVSATSSVFFYSLVRPFIADAVSATAAAAALGLALAFAKLLRPQLKNIAAIAASIGAGAAFGFSFSFAAAMLFMLLMAAYDYLAVFRTKHMVHMAKEIVKRNLSFTITSVQKMPSGKVSRMDLGTGDIALPIMVEVSAFAVHPGLAVASFLGALAGVGTVLFYAWKNRTLLPAIPFIAGGTFLAVAVFLIAAMLIPA